MWTQDDLLLLVRVCDEVVWTYSEHFEVSLRHTRVECLSDRPNLFKIFCCVLYLKTSGSVFWQTVLCYIAWFYRVSHPKLLAPIEGDPPRVANMKVLIYEENAKLPMKL